MGFFLDETLSFWVLDFLGYIYGLKFIWNLELKFHTLVLWVSFSHLRFPKIKYLGRTVHFWVFFIFEPGLKFVKICSEDKTFGLRLLR